MSKAKHNVNDLLAAIQRKTPSSPEPITEVETLRTSSAEPDARGSSRPCAHRVQFYMHDDDRQIVRELSAWLAGQGIRASDSLVIRTTLRLAKTGDDLLATYRQLEQQDGRYKQRRAG
jgi:hypothetical protein